MHHYVDIQLRRDPEITEVQLMAALFAKLHRALVFMPASRIAVSFPGYGLAPPRLGNCLRLIGAEEDLQGLVASSWLGGMLDHVKLDPIAPVPLTTEFRTLRRVQAKSSPERLRRRHMRRHGISEAEANQRVPDDAAERLSLPFLHVASGSTGQHFRLFLRLGPASSTPEIGAFDAYGLSARASIPWF